MTSRAALLVLLLLACAGFALAQPPVTITTPTQLPDGYVTLPYGPPPSFQGLQFTAVLNPSQATATWGIVAGNPPPGLGITSTGLFTGTPSATGDFSFTVGATTQYGKSSQVFTIHIGTPQITFLTLPTLPSGSIGQTYGVTFTANATPPLGLTWFIPDSSMPAGLFLNQATGQLTGTPGRAGVFTIPVTATLTGTEYSATGNFSLTIYAGQVQINSPSILPIATAGVGYTYQLLASPTGATWSLAGSTLPVGFNFDTATGIISGGSISPGAYKFAVQASYPNYNVGTATFTLYVTNGPLHVVENSLPIAIQNVAYSTSVTPGGGLAPFKWSIGSPNPLGFTIDPNTAVISGTPAVPAGTSYPLPVTVSDAAGETYTQAYSVFVAAPLSITTTTLPAGAVGSPYVQALAAAGGQAPYTWLSLTTPGPFPPGLALGTDGVIRGTPTTNGVYPITVQVTDFGKRTAIATLSITVGAPVTLSIGPNSLPDAQPGVPYPPPTGGGVQLTVAGGSSPYIFSITSGSLPQGLSLSNTGLLTGTPVANAPLTTTTFTVSVHDTSSLPAPLTGQKTYTLNVTPPLSLGATSLPNGTIGVTYPQTSLQAGGGQPPYNFSVASGALPNGLNLDASAGTISGKPSGLAGLFTFTILLQDAGGQTVTRQLSISIAAAGTPPVISTGDATGTVGTAFSVTLAATGGTSPYSFVLIGGTPPAGLTFSASTGTLSGTPTTAGSASLTFRVTDAQQQTATKAINISISAPQPPSATIGAISSNPAAQPSVNVALASAYPSDLNGTLSVSFASAEGGSPSEVQFVTSAGGSSTVNFTIPQGQLTAPAFQVVTGTVAGTITVTAKFTAGGQDVTPNPAPTQTIVVKPSAPVITSVSLTNTGGVATVTVVGYSTTREIVSGDFVFTVSSGNTVTNSGDVPVSSFGSAFTTWYQSSASNPFGGQFKLTMPFNVANGNSTSITSVSVKLTNTIGTSAAVSPQ